MQQRPLIAGGVLITTLVAAPLTNPGATMACGVAVAIVLMYGTLVRVVRAWRTHGLMQISRASMASGALAGAAMTALVRVWSDAVDVSIVAGVIAWLVILASGATYATLASRLDRLRTSAATAAA